MNKYWIDGKLGDFLSQIIGGGTPPRNVVDYWDGEIPWASVKDFNESSTKIGNTEEYITRLGLNNSSSNLIPAGIPIMCTRMAVGRCAISDKSIAINQDLKALFPNDKIDNQYLLILLKYHQSALENRAIGSTVKGITLSTLKSFDLSVPKSIQSQQKIAHILTTCDTVIEQTQSAIAKYKAIKQGLLQDLFTRGLDANGRLRPSYHQAPELYKESKLGMIPKEWEVRKLGDVINAVDPQPDHRTPESVENGIPYLGINDIDDFGNVDLRKCRKVSIGILDEHKKRYQVRNGDIIFGKIGTIGEPKRLFNFWNMTLSANVILIQPIGIADYIYWYLLSETVSKQINNSIHTTSQPAFGMEKIRSLNIPTCNDFEQNKIADRLNAIDNKIKSEEVLLQKYQAIKKGLMGDLLGGEERSKKLN
jgi:type I restriction enzyme S subunit